MADARTWGGRGTWFLLMTAMIVLAMLPGEAVPRRWPLPDAMLLVTLAWLVRRPDEVPVSLLAIVFVVADFLSGEAPGLRAALMLMAAEHLRARGGRPEDPLSEWARAAVLILLVSVGERLVLGLTLAPAPPFGPLVLRALAGAAAYPAAVAVVVYALGVRRPPLQGGKR